ncbi:hypothetical protein OPIT5_22320 [Opitutaceae bacterium TAV5]|nr:hypothetical protein OPIT5_22320 [Opitutaceae bacterium TAV5]
MNRSVSSQKSIGLLSTAIRKINGAISLVNLLHFLQ